MARETPSAQAETIGDFMTNEYQLRGRRIAWSRLNLFRAEYYQDHPHLLPANVGWRDVRPNEPQKAPARDILRRSTRSPWHDEISGDTVVVRRENDGPSAEWLAERDVAGREISHGTEGNRIDRALVKDKSPLVATLRQVAELMRPPIVAANDNAPSEDGAQRNNGKGFERTHNQASILPSVPMLLRAYAAGIQSGVRELCGGWHRIGYTDTTDKKKFIGLTFQDGKLIAYGDDKGRKRRPDYIADPLGLVFDKDSETAKHVERQPEENGTYIHLSGAGAYVSSQRPDAPGSIAPPPRTPRAIANDNTLSAARANTPVIPTINRLPDGVAKDYGRLAGIAEGNGIGEGATSAPMHEALSEIERTDQFEAAGIGHDDLDLVEAVLSDASFRTIGLSRGYAESSAHRMGRKVVEDALKRISEKIAA
ncbi:hypothetical protein NOI24_29240 [Neorhizobium galegae]|uniref:hypothetical protein n=1 Tax=Neorhizobium galegae TaxID=399 RepID=UPI00210485C5|nr:hypothetical protein [Neorhizobium galegae]MCQ1775346.1 hypothetical protein [Neorhizobium galegae]MCQ1799892.1 hypothetical protein [Neorhizobium galegae]